MVRYPYMQEIPRQPITVDAWKGYNHGSRIADGESWDEKNITGDAYPTLMPRKQRGIYARPGNAQGLIAKDNLCWVDGSKFMLNGYPIEMGLSELPEDCPKRLVSMGAYVIILPDKKYINTSDTEDRGSIEIEMTLERAAISLCGQDGDDFSGAIKSETAPENPADGQYWVDIGSKPNALRQWSNVESMWVEIGTTYTKIEAAGIGLQFNAFKEWDGVELTGWEDSSNEYAKAMMGSQILQKVEPGYIVVIGLTAEAATINKPLTIKRKMPEMDFVIESRNRLWGCRYGVAANGAVVNEIYASKQGDFKNWNVFQGLSTDSWVGNLGTDGQFTGAANYLGYPVFFKENHIHRVSGIMPSQYSIGDMEGRGVQKGSDRSLKQVNEVLVYKSRTGVCVYDGSLPKDISTVFGDETYSQAVAGALGDKYYISMLRDRTGEPVLMVYDMRQGVWHKEDDATALCFESSRNELYYIDSTAGTIKAVNGSGEQETEPIEWETVSGEIGLTTYSGYYQVNMAEEKYIGKIVMRMQLEEGSEASIAIEYDGSGIWEPAARIVGTGLRSFNIPIRPKRCDWLRLRISGKGKAQIFSRTVYLEGGSAENGGDGMTLDF